MVVAFGAITGLACEGRLDLDYGATPAPSATASATATPPMGTLGFGSGADGARVVTATTSLNVCQPILPPDGAGGASSIVVESAAPFAEGDVVLLWQVQDRFAVVANTAAVLAPGSAGLWELVTVQAIAGNTLVVAPPAAHVYRSGGGAQAQACRIPQFTDVDVVGLGSLRPTSWSGGTGGVLAFFATGTVRLEAPGAMFAVGYGFRGGSGPDGVNDFQDVTDETTDSERSGGKGEGLDPTSFGTYGRGNLANAGGGGNAHNAGGGGGGNGGQGGRGGKQFEGDGDEPLTQGRPGSRVEAEGRLLLAGGGGAAEVHHGSGRVAGSGGGLFLVFARRLEGGGLIDASGESSLDSAQDGGSGGGAGGTVLLYTSGGGFSGMIQARGGNGGGAGGGMRQGPGGGGGGGRVVLQPDLPFATVDVSGGNPGESTTAGDSWGATPGGAGVVVRGN